VHFFLSDLKSIFFFSFEGGIHLVYLLINLEEYVVYTGNHDQLN
jgi:hypothetical protein